METDEAMREAAALLEQYPADGFATTEALVAAAILWGEHLGMRRMRMVALQAFAEAHSKVAT